MSKPQPIHFDGQDVYLVGPMDALLKTLAAAHQLSPRPERMALIIGEQGMGKTLGSRLFAGQHDDVIYIQIPPASILRPGRLLQLMEHTLDMPAGSGAAPTLFDRTLSIISELQRRPRMLIFDNANRIRRYEYIDLLRYIHDESGTRMAFVSIPALEHVFSQYPEFAGRCQFKFRLRPASVDDLVAILTDFEPAAAAKIHEITGGRMREVMVLAEHFRRNRKADPTPANIERVARAFTMRAI